jgi:hypothetical protein
MKEKYKESIRTIKEANPTYGSRRIAKELSILYPDDGIDVEKFASRMRLENSRKDSNKFVETLEEHNFDPPENWHVGWLKTKGASIFVKNSNRGDTVSYERFRDDFMEEMKSYSPFEEKVVRSEKKDPHLLVIDIADLHIGKLSSVRETGESYDVQKAIKFGIEGVLGILSKCNGFDIDRVVFVIGNDVLHIDSTKRTTTSGTPQDTDGMWYDNFVAARKLYCELIRHVARDYDVHVIHVVSNHDYMSGFMLADSVCSFFHNNANVTFDVSMKHRKYYSYGRSLIGFTHGDGAKMDRLPLLMANEAPMDWAASVWRYFLCHHVHHKDQYKFHSAKDYEGVTVEFMRSPSAADGWHHRNGYQHAPKAIEGFLYHADFGQVARITHLFDDK